MQEFNEELKETYGKDLTDVAQYARDSEPNTGGKPQAVDSTPKFRIKAFARCLLSRQILNSQT